MGLLYETEVGKSRRKAMSGLLLMEGFALFDLLLMLYLSLSHNIYFKKKKKVPPGQIAVTSGGNLTCKYL